MLCNFYLASLERHVVGWVRILPTPVVARPTYLIGTIQRRLAWPLRKDDIKFENKETFF